MIFSTRLIYLQTCDIMGAVAPYAARNNITHLSVVSSRQRSYDRLRCEKRNLLDWRDFVMTSLEMRNLIFEALAEKNPEKTEFEGKRTLFLFKYEDGIMESLSTKEN